MVSLGRGAWQGSWQLDLGCGPRWPRNAWHSPSERGRHLAGGGAQAPRKGPCPRATGRARVLIPFVMLRCPSVRTLAQPHRQGDFNGTNPPGCTQPRTEPLETEGHLPQDAGAAARTPPQPFRSSQARGGSGHRQLVASVPPPSPGQPPPQGPAGAGTGTAGGHSQARTQAQTHRMAR